MKAFSHMTVSNSNGNLQTLWITMAIEFVTAIYRFTKN